MVLEHMTRSASVTKNWRLVRLMSVRREGDGGRESRVPIRDMSFFRMQGVDGIRGDLSRLGRFRNVGIRLSFLVFLEFLECPPLPHTTIFIVVTGMTKRTNKTVGRRR